jgi:hypothetical protein
MAILQKNEGTGVKYSASSGTQLLLDRRQTP